MIDGTKRKERPPLKVYCFPEERAQIQANADATGLSLSVYLRRVGMGHTPQSLLDHHRVLDLVKINGDLGRLGGLLKLWLDRRCQNQRPVSSDDSSVADQNRGNARGVADNYEEGGEVIRI